MLTKIPKSSALFIAEDEPPLTPPPPYPPSLSPATTTSSSCFVRFHSPSSACNVVDNRHSIRLPADSRTLTLFPPPILAATTATAPPCPPPPPPIPPPLTRLPFGHPLLHLLCCSPPLPIALLFISSCTSTLAPPRFRRIHFNIACLVLCSQNFDVDHFPISSRLLREISNGDFSYVLNFSKFPIKTGIGYCVSRH